MLDELKRTKGVGGREFDGYPELLRCVSGSVPIAWPNSELRPVTSLRLSRRRTRNTQRARSARNRQPSDQQLIYTVNAKGRLLEPEQFA